MTSVALPFLGDMEQLLQQARKRPRRSPAVIIGELRALRFGQEMDQIELDLWAVIDAALTIRNYERLADAIDELNSHLLETDQTVGVGKCTEASNALDHILGPDRERKRAARS